ncbi:hypothetical protein M011DRAFT_478733 [Sporormia fimetaria CBS 119925]|uniref:Uncharacterized protein n=1 Tax=Sporormia fimetaria CBS 119925 TaxID=1340428 RepID=A0A6A6V9K9_9PLEO|nr:hypothetical protein M011DRAFT_478733 [Sporormia fimetaria CBS 119925]
MSLYNALIRTHHITSQKKIAALRTAAAHHNVYALLRRGGCPGIMYCEGSETGVKDWVATVQRLRYKDYQLAVKPAALVTLEEKEREDPLYGRLEELDSVKEYGAKMGELGLWGWWRKGMGYVSD